MALRPPSNTEPPKPGSREAAQADGFLREVDEALREEEMVNSFKRFAKPVGGVIAAGLLALGGYLWWEHSQNAAAGELSARAALAVERLEAGEVDAANTDFAALAKEDNDAIRAMALMQMATIAAKQGKNDAAAKQFAAIAADAKLPQPYRDLATVREVSLKFDAMKPEDVIARLKPLAVPGNAFFGSAGELLGMAYLDQGKPDLAGALFAQIGQDKKVPASLRARMRQLAGGLGYDAGVDMKEIETQNEGAAGAAAQGAPAAPAQQAPKQ
ncbi:MAG: tetratricopeptide repeat protein [Novosphingobium sp.]